ncbi:substrate-binding domain-containing protein [Nocardiopsis changdeensis]|uniref:Substrate-binding domain-containing protein n=1 Tax=Nocardiopsis changdeensis TaxID=2831969 RepID=A0ABX8BJZ3_9ACTN|nr:MULTISPECIES: serine/threonine-protein kinase [Nocardiopsis]QUX22545.1 substrate-binding domain-containing protein [Nocardiopsis changdeensis]QYX38486.1 substrate-binding domain-containing protein [Nocardiopsis sp. MT53]
MRQPAPDLTPLRASDPRTIPPFTVHGRLGAGGMGVVYGATGPDGRWAAIKVVRDEFSGEPEFRARFAAEVELMLRVRALCVAPVLAHDAHAEHPWYATAYLPGPTLARRVRVGGPLPAGQARVVAAGIAEAVAAIHAAGVVHRDLKPANVILAPDGPKVLDFGIARAADLTSHTRTGGLIGSPAWMSPERYRGDSGPEADVFAWGAVAAYTATGRSPFGEGGAETLMYRILHEEPDLDGLPAELAEPVRRALAKDPALRPRASELVHAVAGVPREQDDTTIVTGLIRAHWDQGDTAPGGRPTGAPPGAPTPLPGNGPSPAPGGPPPHGPVPPGGLRPAGAAPPPRRRRVWPLALGAGALAVTLVGGVGVTALLLDGLRGVEGDDGTGDFDAAVAPSAEPSTLSGVVTGSGSTFLGPTLEAWAAQYGERQPGAEISYQPVGSGAGAQEFVDGATDFGSSEAPLTADQAAAAEEARGCPVVQFPVLTGSVAIIHNIEDGEEVTLSAQALADIFSGRVTDYGDLADSEFTGPDGYSGPITAVRHDDGASTAQVFERYLETEAEWAPGGWGESVRVASGDEGVAEMVAQTPGAIGFANVARAQEMGLYVASLYGPEQQVLFPEGEAARAAAEQIDLTGGDFSLTGRVTGDGYPIMRVNHVFAYECGYDDGVGEVMRDFWTYSLGQEGADLAEGTGNLPLPPEVAEGVLERVALIGSSS